MARKRERSYKAITLTWHVGCLSSCFSYTETRDRPYRLTCNAGTCSGYRRENCPIRHDADTETCGPLIYSQENRYHGTLYLMALQDLGGCSISALLWIASIVNIHKLLEGTRVANETQMLRLGTLYGAIIGLSLTTSFKVYITNIAQPTTVMFRSNYLG